MQIIIDTKRDSPDEIRKAISLLNNLIGSNISQQDKEVPPVQEGMFNMFSDNSPANPSNNEDLENGESDDGSEKLETY